MPNYAVDGGRQSMVATGVVGESADMQQAADKSWSNVGQRRCPDTGQLVWDVEVLYTRDVWGRVSSTTAMVAVPGVEAPKVAVLAPIRFEGLRVVVSINKAKGLSERWSADAIASGPVGRRGAAGAEGGAA
jgi:hypothetical protein